MRTTVVRRTGHARRRRSHRRPPGRAGLAGISLTYCATCKAWHVRDTACRAAAAHERELVELEPHVPRI